VDYYSENRNPGVFKSGGILRCLCLNEREGDAIPLTKKGSKIKKAMKEQYGKEKGEKVFYASQNKGTITGTHKEPKRKKSGGLMN